MIEPRAASAIEHGTPAFRRANIALFAAGFSTFGLLYCVQPLMPALSEAFGVSAADASLALSLSTGLLAVSLLLAGAVSEVWGRKPIMAASLFASAALTMLVAFAPSWSSLLAARALAGIALSGLPSVAMAYVTEEMHPRSVGLAMGLYIGGSSIGGMSGRLFTGVASELFGWRVAVFSVGLLGAAMAALFWASLPPSRNFRPQTPDPGALLRNFISHLGNPVLRLLFLEGFLAMGAFVAMYNYIGYRLLAPPFSLSQAEIGAIFTAYLAGSASSACVGYLSGRIGRPRILSISFVVMLTGIAITLSGNLWLIVLGIVLLTVGFFAAHATASSWVGAQATRGRAQASSLYLFAYYMGSSVIGSVAGLLWIWQGWEGVVAVTGLLTCIGLAASLRLGRR